MEQSERAHKPCGIGMETCVSSEIHSGEDRGTLEPERHGIRPRISRIRKNQERERKTVEANSLPSKLRADNGTIGDELALANLRIDGLDATDGTLEHNLAAANLRINSLDRTNGDLERNLETANSKIKSLDSKNKTLDCDNVEIKAKFDSLKRTNDTLINNLKNANARFKKVLKEVRTDCNIDIEETLLEIGLRETIPDQVNIIGMTLLEGSRMVIKQVITDFKSMRD
ncbi:hypothetical protein V500_09438 [Pseudogymnoascus sp. VKM F-4518 (FW-2643)]|nr:hypothetical protein V500_09438 [Pseudogymnoascus sp. VKM F-4518 (FW-2643)]